MPHALYSKYSEEIQLLYRLSKHCRLNKHAKTYGIFALKKKKKKPGALHQGT